MFYIPSSIDLKKGKIKMSYVDKFRQDILKEPGFDQFKDHPDNLKITERETCHSNKHIFYVQLSAFKNIDISKLNAFRFGTYQGNFFKDIDGSTEFGSANGISIQFQATLKE